MVYKKNSSGNGMGNLSRNSIMKIGLLITDDDQNYGGEEGIRDAIVQRLRDVSDGNIDLKIKTFFVVNGEFPSSTNNFDGFIVTGSHYSVNDELPWMCLLEKFIQEVYRDPTGPKLLGICFGHQLIAKALGGTVGRNPTGNFIWCSGRVEVTTDLSEKDYYKQAFGDTNATFHIMQSHYEQVLEKPECARNAGTAPGECEHEVLVYDDKVLTMQGHPEGTVKRMREITLPILKKYERVTKEEEAIAMISFEKENGDQLVNLIFNFLKS